MNSGWCGTGQREGNLKGLPQKFEGLSGMEEWPIQNQTGKNLCTDQDVLVRCIAFDGTDGNQKLNKPDSRIHAIWAHHNFRRQFPETSSELGFHTEEIGLTPKQCFNELKALIKIFFSKQVRVKAGEPTSLTLQQAEWVLMKVFEGKVAGAKVDSTLSSDWENNPWARASRGIILPSAHQRIHRQDRWQRLPGIRRPPTQVPAKRQNNSLTWEGPHRVVYP